MLYSFITFSHLLHSLLMTNHIISFKSISDCSLNICYSGHAQTAMCVTVLPPCLLVTNLHDILEKWITKRGNLPTKIKEQQKTRSGNPASQTLREHKWSCTEGRADSKNMTMLPSEKLNMPVRGTLWGWTSPP